MPTPRALGVQLYSGPDWFKFHHLGLEQARSGK